MKREAPEIQPVLHINSPEQFSSSATTCGEEEFEPRIIPILTTAMSQGQERAWGDFHRHYFSRLHRYLIVLQGGDDDAAAELVQLTMLRIVRHIRRFESEAVFWSWLTCLARCTAADEGRKRKRRISILEKFAHWQELRQQDTGTVNAQMEVLEKCLASMEPVDRALLEGKYFQRQTYEQLAVTFAMTPKAVESKLARLRAKLRQAIEAETSDPTAETSPILPSQRIS